MKNIKKLFLPLAIAICFQNPCNAGFMDTLSSFGNSALQWIQQNPKITGLFATVFTAQAVYSYKQYKTIKNLNIDLGPFEQRDTKIENLDNEIKAEKEQLEQLKLEYKDIQDFKKAQAHSDAAYQEFINEQKLLKKTIEHFNPRAIGIAATLNDSKDELLAHAYSLIKSLESPEQNDTKELINKLYENGFVIHIPYQGNLRTTILKRLELLKEEIGLNENLGMFYHKSNNTSPIDKALFTLLLFKSIEDNSNDSHKNDVQILIHPDKEFSPNYQLFKEFNVQSSTQLINDGVSFVFNQVRPIFTALPKPNALKLPIKNHRTVTLPHLPSLQIGFLYKEAKAITFAGQIINLNQQTLDRMKLLADETIIIQRNNGLLD